jgi:sulfur carrier protein ThiS
MKVYLRVYGHLDRYNNQSLEWQDVETSKQDIKDFLIERGIPTDEVCFLVKNGEFMEWDDLIEEEDRIELVPPIEGG